MIAPIVIKAVAIGAVAEVITLAIAQVVPTDSTAVYVAAIGSVTSVALALINYRISKRTEHTVNSKTSSLEAKIESLKELGASKDATIAAQITIPVGAPIPVVVVDTTKPLEVIDKTPEK